MPKFREKRDPVEAVRLSFPLTVDTPGGPFPANIGDWLVTEPEGTQLLVAGHLFPHLYEAIDPPTPQPAPQPPQPPRPGEKPQLRVISGGKS